LHRFPDAFKTHQENVGFSAGLGRRDKRHDQEPGREKAFTDADRAAERHVLASFDIVRAEQIGQACLVDSDVGGPVESLQGALFFKAGGTETIGNVLRIAALDFVGKDEFEKLRVVEFFFTRIRRDRATWAACRKVSGASGRFSVQAGSTCKPPGVGEVICRPEKLQVEGRLLISHRLGRGVVVDPC
jgi:hypothetical protein